MSRAKYLILLDADDLIIKDMGHGTGCPTVTNDAEAVVAELAPRLSPRQRLLYYDSDNNLDELKIKDGKFVGFGPIRPR